MLLVGPQGHQSLLMSDAGGTDPSPGVDLTLDNSAPAALPETDHAHHGDLQTDRRFADVFPAVPQPTRAADLSVFNGTDPNGVWALYAVDDGRDDLSAILGGWSLDIESARPRSHAAARPVVLDTAAPTGTVVGGRGRGVHHHAAVTVGADRDRHRTRRRRARSRCASATTARPGRPSSPTPPPRRGRCAAARTAPARSSPSSATAAATSPPSSPTRSPSTPRPPGPQGQAAPGPPRRQPNARVKVDRHRDPRPGQRHLDDRLPDRRAGHDRGHPEVRRRQDHPRPREGRSGPARTARRSPAGHRPRRQRLRRQEEAGHPDPAMDVHRLTGRGRYSSAAGRLGPLHSARDPRPRLAAEQRGRDRRGGLAARRHQLRRADRALRLRRCRRRSCRCCWSR